MWTRLRQPEDDPESGDDRLPIRGVCTLYRRGEVKACRRALPLPVSEILRHPACFGDNQPDPVEVLNGYRYEHRRGDLQALLSGLTATRFCGFSGATFAQAFARLLRVFRKDLRESVPNGALGVAANGSFCSNASDRLKSRRRMLAFSYRLDPVEWG